MTKGMSMMREDAITYLKKKEQRLSILALCGITAKDRAQARVELRRCQKMREYLSRIGTYETAVEYR